jgi:regulator of sigma E protease
VAPRAAIVAAGPIANFILAIVIFAGIFTFYGKQSTAARVDTVAADSAAAAAGFVAGDVVTGIDGRQITNFNDMQRIVSSNAGQELTITVNRGGVPITLKATPPI